MSYNLYSNITKIEQAMNEPQYHTDGREITNEIIFGTFVDCYNEIANTVRYNRGLPFFNLKQGWALIKAQDFETALTNVKNWLQATDGRYDGENWNEN